MHKGQSSAIPLIRNCPEPLVAELPHNVLVLVLQLGELARVRDEGTQDWTRRFHDLAALIEGHFHREEHELLPLAREILGEEESKARMDIADPVQRSSALALPTTVQLRFLAFRTTTQIELAC